MNVIKTPTGLIPVDKPGELLTQAEYNNLTDEKKRDGTYYIINSDGNSILGIIKNGISLDSTPKPLSVNASASLNNWSGSSAPYTNSVTINGVTATNIVEVGLSSNANDDQVKACMAASIAKITQTNNGIVLYAYGTKPTVDIPLTCVIINN